MSIINNKLRIMNFIKLFDIQKKRKLKQYLINLDKKIQLNYYVKKLISFFGI